MKRKTIIETRECRSRHDNFDKVVKIYVRAHASAVDDIVTGIRKLISEIDIDL